MICPKCQNTLESNFFGFDDSIEIGVCPSCEGMWVDKGKLNDLDDSITINSEEAEFSIVKTQNEKMACPNCKNTLKTISPIIMPELEVDTCTSCHGFWLDKDELEGIRDMVLKLDSIQLKNANINLQNFSNQQNSNAMIAMLIAGSL